MSASLREISDLYSALMTENGTERYEDGDRVFSLSELVYTFECSEGDWVPVGLGYSLFGFDLARRGPDLR